MTRAKSVSSQSMPGKSGQGAIWTAGSRVVAQCCQFGLLIVAARFLTPAEFGVFSLFSAAAMGLAVFSRAGWRECIIVMDDDAARAHANVMSLIVGAISASIGAIASIVVWMVLENAAYLQLGIGLSVWLLLSGVTTPQVGILTRRHQLIELGKYVGLAEFAGLIVGIVALCAHWGIMALVFSKLAYQVFAFGMLLKTSRWFPLTRLNPSVLREVSRFSANIWSTEVAWFLQTNASLFIIGAFAGALETGVFRAGARFSGAVQEIIGEPIRLLAWSIFRSESEKNNPGAVATKVPDFTAMATLCAAPLFVGMALTSENIVNLVFGPSWIGAAPVMAILAIANLIAIPALTTVPLLGVTGKSHVVPRLVLSYLVLSLCVLSVFAPYGAMWIAVSQLVVAVVWFPINVWIQRRCGVDWRLVVRSVMPVLVPTGFMAIAVYATGRWLNDFTAWQTLTVQMLAGACGFLALGWLTARTLMRRLLSSLRAARSESDTSPEWHSSGAFRRTQHNRQGSPGYPESAGNHEARTNRKAESRV